MSDDLNATLAALRGQAPPRAFAPAEDVRRRGSQRTVRQAVAAVAAVAVIGGGTGWLATSRPSAAPAPRPDIAASRSADQAPNPSATPPVATAVPSQPGDSTTPSEALLLQPADLGPGQWRRTRHELLEGNRWYWGNLCPAYGTDADYPSLGNQRSIDTASWVDAAYRRMSELVELYAPGTGVEYLRTLESLLARCTRASKWPSGEAPASYLVEARDFSGDQALLIHIEERVYGEGEALAPDPIHRYVAVVRVGDRIATVIPPASTGTQAQASAARTLAEKAAARLR